MRATPALILLFTLSFGCQTKTKNVTESNRKEDTTPLALQPDTVRRKAGTTLNLSSGRYKGGLKLAVNGNTFYGFYENSYGWNEQVKAPQFSCAYTFTGEYTGSDSIALTFAPNDALTGTLEILSPTRIRIKLSANPCENERATTEVLEIEKAYPLLAIKEIAAAKAYFYSSPEAGTQRKAYLIKGDAVEVDRIKDDWYHVIYYGEKSTTGGWMNASAFANPPSADLLQGKWLAKAGEQYEIFFKFYPNNRYKTWSINSFEPQGMTGNFMANSRNEIYLHPCTGPTETLPIKDISYQQITLMIPGTSTWTAFEKRTDSGNLENADFLIEKRKIRTVVNNKVLYIPSTGKKEDFLKSVCPFEVIPDVLVRGEGEFDILRISTPEKGSLFYAIVDGENITSLVIEVAIVHAPGIAVGTTFAELKKAIPSATVNRSEMEGRVIGTTTDFSYSFGYLDGTLFNKETGTIPDTVRIKQIIL